MEGDCGDSCPSQELMEKLLCFFSYLGLPSVTQGYWGQQTRITVTIMSLGMGIINVLLLLSILLIDPVFEGKQFMFLT